MVFGRIRIQSFKNCRFFPDHITLMFTLRSHFKDLFPVLYAQDDRRDDNRIYFQNAKHKDIFRLLAPGPGAEDLRQTGHLSLPRGDQEVRQRRDQCRDRQVTAAFHPVRIQTFFLNPDLEKYAALKK
jgi:hypothetical protein